MGAGSSTYTTIFSRPSKKLKVEMDGQALNINNCHTQEKCEQNLSHQDCPLHWNNLPYVALLEVYRMLPNNDKYNVSLTCKSWTLPFSRPALWRRGHFLFNGVDDWRAMCFASMMGAALHHITADCSAENTTMAAKSGVESAAKLADFLRSIKNARNRLLITLELTNMRRLVRYIGNLEVVRRLTSILKMQTNLQKLDLTNAGLDVDEGIQLIISACVSCGDKLEHFYIGELMASTGAVDIGADGRFLFVLSKLTNLSELGLSHSYLSDNVLFLLSGTVPGKLKLIKVWAVYTGRADKRTSLEAWAHLCFRCPDLKAEFIVKGISHDQSLSDILTPTIPLRHLTWNSGNYTTMVNTKVCFDHIITYFPRHLQHLELDLHYAFFDDEEDIGAIVQRCLLLESLTLTSKFIVPPRQVKLERAIRRGVMQQPTSRLRDVHINGKKIDLEETWLTTVVEWLVEHIH